MKTIVTTSLVAGLCLTPLAATPAFAAQTPPATATTAAPLSEGFDGLAVEKVIVAIDQEERTVLASVNVSGADPKSLYVLSNPESHDHPNLRVAANGYGHANVELVPGQLNHLKLLRYTDGGAEQFELPIDADDRRSYGAPKVDVVEHADTGRADVTVTGEVGAQAYVLNDRGVQVAAARLTSPSHTFDIALQKNAASYSAIQIKDYYRTPGTTFTLGAVDPAVPPVAPQAHAVYRDASRALVDVTADAGTVIKVRDEGGKVIALRLVPATGTSQVLVPLASDEVDVTVTRGTAESAPTPVELTAAPTR